MESRSCQHSWRDRPSGLSLDHLHFIEPADAGKGARKLRVEYGNTLADLLLFYTAQQLSSLAMQGYLLAGSTLVAYLTTVDSDCGGFSPCTELFGFSFLVTYVVVLVAQLMFSAFYLLREDNRASVTHHSVQLTEEGVFDQTRYQQSLYFWEGILSVISVAGFVAIYVTPNMAVIIPPRAFPTTRDREELISFTRGHVSAARTLGSTNPAR